MEIKEIDVTVKLDRQNLWDIKVGLESYMRSGGGTTRTFPNVILFREILGILGLAHEFEPTLERIESSDANEPNSASL